MKILLPLLLLASSGAAWAQSAEFWFSAGESLLSNSGIGSGSTKFGLNYGGGVKVKLTSMWGLRFDVRRYETRKPFDLFLKDGWLHQTEVSGGVGLMF